MSIRHVIKERIASGDLAAIEPAMPDDPVRRHMVVSAEIQRLLDGPWVSRAMEIRCGRLRADLETFVSGKQLAVCLTPYEAKTAYMARLEKPADEVWDIRSRDPRPGLRILGRFAETDLFVALLCGPRSVDVAWSPRLPLLDGASREWRNAIVECKALWRRLFHPYQPLHGEDLHDYLSSNAFLV